MDDDCTFAEPLSEPQQDSDPTARGIVQCLRMLADEAATLRMARTLAALQTAITVCAAEGDADGGDAAGRRRRFVPTGIRLH